MITAANLKKNELNSGGGGFRDVFCRIIGLNGVMNQAPAARTGKAGRLIPLGTGLLRFFGFVLLICHPAGISHSGAYPHPGKYPYLEEEIYRNKNSQNQEITHQLLPFLLPLAGRVNSFLLFSSHSCPDMLSTSSHPVNIGLRWAVALGPVVVM